MISKFNLIFQQVLIDLIKDVKDLKQFYKNVQYSLVDWKHNKSFNDVYFSDDIYLKPIRISNKNDIDKFLLGMNLAAIASGDKAVTKDGLLAKFNSCLKYQKFYFIMQNNKIIGTVRLFFNQKSNAININDFAIFSDSQGQGLGRLSLIAIIKYILRTYKQNLKITLGVAKVNKKAFNLYNEIGFDIIQKGRTYYYMQLNQKYFDYLVNSNIDKWMNQWKLLSPTQVIKYNCGICYDTAKMSDYYLTKWNIQHKNYFACSQKNYKDHAFNDPTHTFTIYLDKKDNYWKWLEGSWQNFKKNEFKSKNYNELVNWIVKALANSSKLTNIAAQFIKFPKIGCTLKEFGKWTTILNYTYRQQPDGNSQKYALDEIKDILNNLGINYGYYNPQTNKIIDDNDPNNPLPDSAFNNYKLQNFQDILNYRLGVCWDCTLVIDKLLTTANIKHINIFLYGGGDQYTTHTTTIYTLDNKTWRWCDGSWHIFGSKDDKKSEWSDTNHLKLIERIKKEHQKTFKLKQKVYEIINYPEPGCTANQFIKNIIKFGIQIF